jgi:hypothetical protein
MTAAPPGGTARVRFDTLPLIYLHQDVAAAQQSGAAPPGSTTTVHADVVPPLWFEFATVPAKAKPATRPGQTPTVGTSPSAHPPSGETLAATGWTPSVASLMPLGLSWVLARRLRKQEEPEQT